VSARKHRSAKERARLFLLHGGICHLCEGKIEAATEAWDISHDIPLELGGADDDENSKIAHRKCHRAHTAKVDIPRIAKAKRVEQKHLGLRKSSRPLAGSKASGWHKHMDGTVSRRTT